MTEPVRIAMWSGPRNISTAMMRAFENRGDTAVIDEPFYACFLSITGRTDHPMRDEVLRTLPSDWRIVVKNLLGPVPGGKTMLYQKHMTHHMVPPIGLDWISGCTNVFLIRDPAEVVASYSKKIARITIADIGIVRQWEIFEQERKRLGRAPIVVESRAVLENPRGTLSALCAVIGIPFVEGMLHWPPGRRESDGIWAPYWYVKVERSTGFEPPPSPKKGAELSADLKLICAAARPYYEWLSEHKIRA
ncbi:MAG: HAD family hydrolase [Alphaproteobacteria bacterium]